MESIEQMIKRLCPEGVEYVKLGEVCKLERGKVFSKKYIEENKGDYPVYSSQTANNGELGKINSYNYDGEFLTWTTDGAYAGTIFYRRGKFSITNVCGMIKNNEELFHIRFLYHWLSVKAKEYVYEGMGNPKLMSNQAAEIEIPLPPMEIQNRIVEVLDKMTTLTAELEAELEAELDCRKRQYEYYRNKLLTFNEIGGGIRPVTWKKISEIAHYPKARIKSEMLTVDTYVGVESLIKDRGGKTSSSSVPEGAAIEFLPQDILIGNIRPYLKKIWLSDCQGGTNGDVVCIRVLDSKEVMPKFLYYILASDAFFDYDNSHAKGGKMPRGDKNAILSYNIPVPSMEEQERIVSILDRFEALTTDLKKGLPAEIKARRQQYEYYRNKLLTFERR